MAIRIRLKTKDLLFYFELYFHDPNVPTENDSIFIKCLLEDFNAEDQDLKPTLMHASVELINRTIYYPSKKILIKTDLLFGYKGTLAVVHACNFILSKKIYSQIDLNNDPNVHISSEDKFNLRKYLLLYQQSTNHLEVISVYNQSVIFRSLVNMLIQEVLDAPFNLYVSGIKLSKKYQKKRISEPANFIFQRLLTLAHQRVILSEDIMQLYDILDRQGIAESQWKGPCFFKCKNNTIRVQNKLFKTCLTLIATQRLIKGSFPQIAKEIHNHTSLKGDVARLVGSYL